MAILALFRWQADADALVAAHDREMEDAPSVVVPLQTVALAEPTAALQTWNVTVPLPGMGMPQAI